MNRLTAGMGAVAVLLLTSCGGTAVIGATGTGTVTTGTVTTGTATAGTGTTAVTGATLVNGPAGLTRIGWRRSPGRDEHLSLVTAITSHR